MSKLCLSFTVSGYHNTEAQDTAMCRLLFLKRDEVKSFSWLLRGSRGFVLCSALSEGLRTLFVSEEPALYFDPGARAPFPSLKQIQRPFLLSLRLERCKADFLSASTSPGLVEGDSV